MVRTQSVLCAQQGLVCRWAGLHLPQADFLIAAPSILEARVPSCNKDSSGRCVILFSFEKDFLGSCTVLGTFLGCDRVFVNSVDALQPSNEETESLMMKDKTALCRIILFFQEERLQ